MKKVVSLGQETNQSQSNQKIKVMKESAIKIYGIVMLLSSATYLVVYMLNN